MAQDMFPNSTQTPNVILDEWMPVLSGPEFKIISLLVRQTIGFQLDKETGRRKDRDWLNIKQIIKKNQILIFRRLQALALGISNPSIMIYGLRI